MCGVFISLSQINTHTKRKSTLKNSQHDLEEKNTDFPATKFFHMRKRRKTLGRDTNQLKKERFYKGHKKMRGEEGKKEKNVTALKTQKSNGGGEKRKHAIQISFSVIRVTSIFFLRFLVPSARTTTSRYHSAMWNCSIQGLRPSSSHHRRHHHRSAHGSNDLPPPKASSAC